MLLLKNGKVELVPPRYTPGCNGSDKPEPDMRFRQIVPVVLLFVEKAVGKCAPGDSSPQCRTSLSRTLFGDTALENGKHGNAGLVSLAVTVDEDLAVAESRYGHGGGHGSHGGHGHYGGHGGHRHGHGSHGYRGSRYGGEQRMQSLLQSLVIVLSRSTSRYGNDVDCRKPSRAPRWTSSIRRKETRQPSRLPSWQSSTSQPSRRTSRQARPLEQTWKVTSTIELSTLNIYVDVKSSMPLSQLPNRRYHGDRGWGHERRWGHHRHGRQHHDSGSRGSHHRHYGHHGGSRHHGRFSNCFVLLVLYHFIFAGNYVPHT